MNYKIECPHCQQSLELVLPPPEAGVTTTLEAPSTPRSILPIIASTAACTLLFVAAIFGCFLYFRSPHSSATAQSTDSDAIQTLKRYFAAVRWEDRLPLVRTPERVKNWMRDHYQDYKGPVAFKSIAARNDLKLPDGFTAYEVTFSDREPQIYFIEKSPAGYKIDWEMVVLNPRSIKSFQVDRPTIPESFRTVAQLDTYYNGDFFGTDQTYYSIQLSFPEGDILHGYVQRKSKDGAVLYDLLKDGKQHRTILLLRYLPRSQSSYTVEIFRFIQAEWIQKNLSPTEDFARLAQWYRFGYDQGAALRAAGRIFQETNVASREDLRELLTSCHLNPNELSADEFDSCYDGFSDGVYSKKARFSQQSDPPPRK